MEEYIQPTLIYSILIFYHNLVYVLDEFDPTIKKVYISKLKICLVIKFNEINLHSMYKM